MSHSARKRKKGHGGGHDGTEERWLITYADMITLLMAFFIMLYSMSIVNLGKFAELAVSVRSGFGGEEVPMMGHSLGISSGAEVMPSVLPASSFELMTSIAGSIARAAGNRETENIDFLSEGGVVTIRVKADDVLFPRGSATLTARAKKTLTTIAGAIRALPYDMRVEGHTCNLPIHTARFPSNWELSTQRAVSVVLYLVRNEGLSPRRLSAAGYADTVPVAGNGSEENRRRNRRIDIVILRDNRPVHQTDDNEDMTATPHITPSAVDLSPELRDPEAEADETETPEI